MMLCPMQVSRDWKNYNCAYSLFEHYVKEKHRRFALEFDIVHGFGLKECSSSHTQNRTKGRKVQRSGTAFVWSCWATDIFSKHYATSIKYYWLYQGGFWCQYLLHHHVWRCFREVQIYLTVMILYDRKLVCIFQCHYFFVWWLSHLGDWRLFLYTPAPLKFRILY